MIRSVISSRVVILVALGAAFFLCAPLVSSIEAADLASGRWVEICRDAHGARRGSAMRFVEQTGTFHLWGFMDSDPDHLQENPLMVVPEYDMVTFDPEKGRWENQFPPAWEATWKDQLPLASVARTYSGITNGSKQTILRSPSDSRQAAPRPDLNVVFDQVVYHPPTKSLVYFTGGLTATYDTVRRHWSDLSPPHRPPPVLGGSLAFNPVHDEIVLFGGGHVIEPGPDGTPVGYTDTWHYSISAADWRREIHSVQPPPRMNSRLVCDTKNQKLILFGGDAQSHYLADTWLYDLTTRRWSPSNAVNGPPPRAGHFTVYDPETGLVFVGGGYNRDDLSDMWAYDAANDRWMPVQGDVPTGFYLTGDLDVRRRLLLLVVNSSRPGDQTACNMTYPVRTTYGYRIDSDDFFATDSGSPQSHPPMAKKPPQPVRAAADDDSGNQKAVQRLARLPINRWVELTEPGRVPPTRTWGSATFDQRRRLIQYWGGGHCGYGGNDVDSYDVRQHTWRSSDPSPEFPERLWDRGANTAGITFKGRPWMTHGRSSYAADPVSGRMVMVRLVRLPTGYDPELVRDYPGAPRARPGAIVSTPSWYAKWTTWTFDPDDGTWELLCEAPYGLDTLVTTPEGVAGVTVSWRHCLADSGYMLPWRESQEGENRDVYRLDVANRKWERLGGSANDAPQNLYELTSLIHDPKRNRILLHGGGARRDQLWAFDLSSKRWQHLSPRVANPRDANPPACMREAVYLPDRDMMVTVGPAREDRQWLAFWEYRCGENAWYRMKVPPKRINGWAGQNRALVYDPDSKVMFLVLGMHGDKGTARLYALRYEHDDAEAFTATEP